MAGIECKPVSVEITYGLERICMFTQQKKNVYDLAWNEEGIKYGDVFLQITFENFPIKVHASYVVDSREFLH